MKIACLALPLDVTGLTDSGNSIRQGLAMERPYHQMKCIIARLDPELLGYNREF
jgi:hypothetical protein